MVPTYKECTFNITGLFSEKGISQVQNKQFTYMWLGKSYVLVTSDPEDNFDPHMADIISYNEYIKITA